MQLDITWNLLQDHLKVFNEVLKESLRFSTIHIKTSENNVKYVTIIIIFIIFMQGILG